jgi:YfiH family protein
VVSEVIVPDWLAPRGVRALITTRTMGDMKSEDGKLRLRALLPAEPVWLRQVHGTGVVDAASAPAGTAADASFSRMKNTVCVVMAADCMPVLFAHEDGGVVGAAHAGWRGLCAGVIESTIAAMGVPADRVIAWLGPAIGPGAYEIGEEVRAAFVDRDSQAAAAFRPTRPGQWHLDLYAVARQRLAAQGATRVFGGGFCTASDQHRFFSYRRDRASERMAAVIWIG